MFQFLNNFFNIVVQVAVNCIKKHFIQLNLKPVCAAAAFSQKQTLINFISLPGVKICQHLFLGYAHQFPWLPAIRDIECGCHANRYTGKY